MDQESADNALHWYDLERYLFETVGPRFRREHTLTAFDFFSIVIWKANRAKSRIAKRLKENREGRTLSQIVEELARTLAAASNNCDRMRILFDDFGFLLPMASAVLTVLWPDQFTIYDVRACEQLDQCREQPDRFGKLGATTKFSEDFWKMYLNYCMAVAEKVPGSLSLRDKDRVLWARSSMQQLKREIEAEFIKKSRENDD